MAERVGGDERVVYLADNWQAGVIWLGSYIPFLFSALAFSQGGSYRKALWYNFGLCISFGVLYLFAGLITLLPENDLIEVFHFASIQFNSPCPAECYPTDRQATSDDIDAMRQWPACETCSKNPTWVMWQQPKPHGPGGSSSPEMSFYQRLGLFLIASFEGVLITALQKFVVTGPGAAAIAARFDDGQRRELKL